MNNFDEAWERVLLEAMHQRVVDRQIIVENRTGTRHIPLGAHIFKHGVHPAYEYANGSSLGLLRSKHTSYKMASTELAWMMNGGTNVRWLQEHGVTFWDEWADKNGDLGPVYGAQWRNFGGRGVDQLWEVFCKLRSSLKTGSCDRRIMVSAWNPDDLLDMALPPCHFAWQVTPGVDRDRKQCLSLQCFQRSGDLFLGIPYNMAFYDILRRLLVDLFDVESQRGITSLLVSDTHLYENHVDAANEVLAAREEHLSNMSSNGRRAWFAEAPTFVPLSDFHRTDFKKKLMQMIDSRDHASFNTIDWYDVIKMYHVPGYRAVCKVSAPVAV